VQPHCWSRGPRPVAARNSETACPLHQLDSSTARPSALLFPPLHCILVTTFPEATPLASAGGPGKTPSGTVAPPRHSPRRGLHFGSILSASPYTSPRAVLASTYPSPRGWFRVSMGKDSGLCPATPAVASGSGRGAWGFLGGQCHA